MPINQKRRLLLTAAALLGVGQLYAKEASTPRIIKVVARKFVFTPDTIPLKKDETVELELTTEDVVMGFNAPDLKVRSDIIPGMVKRLRITPENTGKFTFHCDIFCGSGHEDMAGTIVVT